MAKWSLGGTLGQAAALSLLAVLTESKSTPSLIKQATNEKVAASVTVFSAHASQACSVDFNDEFAITGSDGCSVAVWDKSDGRNIHLLTGHTQGQTSSRLNNNLDAVCQVQDYNARLKASIYASYALNQFNVLTNWKHCWLLGDKIRWYVFAKIFDGKVVHSCTSRCFWNPNLSRQCLNVVKQSHNGAYSKTNVH